MPVGLTEISTGCRVPLLL